MIKLYELTNSDACQQRRAFTFPMDTKETAIFKKAVAIKSAIKDILDGKIKEKELDEKLTASFEEIPYFSKKQREIQKEEAKRIILRYTREEDASSLVKAQTKVVDIGYGLEVQLTPDFIRIDDNTIEVIYLKASKPVIGPRQAKSDLTMLSLYKYGRACQMPGEKKKVIASLYYLRKKNRDDEETFFTGDTSNITQLVGSTIELGEDDYILKGFDKKLKEYAEGLPKDQCTEKDCKACYLNNICHYTESPIAFTEEHKVFDPRSVKLSKEQKRIIDYEAGQLRVNAGAGAGKTLVLTLRLVALINKGVDPEKILTITFTNAGAEEIRNRVEGIFDQMGLKEKAEKLKIQTFNSFGNEIIEKEFKQLGFTQKPKLIDDIERSRIITDLLNANHIEGLDYKNFTMNMGSNLMGALAKAKQVFDYVKKNQISAHMAETVCRDFNLSQEATYDLIKLYDQYDQKLREENLIEYTDQEMLLFELLHLDPYYYESLGFEYIMVDEFQDTSARQIEILKGLMDTPSYKGIMAIGDDSQAIYSFRDTSPEYILNLEKYIGREVEDINLVENHRSTPEILDAANRVNRLRRERVEKDLVATRPSGKPVRIEGFLDKEAEYRFIVEDIKKHLSDGFNPEDISFIAATKDELKEMAALLNKENIQSVFMNPESLIKNSSVIAALSYISALQDESATKEILTWINALKRGGLLSLSNTELSTLVEECKASINAWHALPTDEVKREELMKTLKSIDYNDDEVYQSFLNSIAFKPSMAELYRYVRDFEEFGERQEFRREHSFPGVALTTAHSSKGTEYPVIYNSLSKYDGEKVGSVMFNAYQEKLRLLFVSMTRARDELIITSRLTVGKRDEFYVNRFLTAAAFSVGREEEFTYEAVKELIEQKEAEKKKEKALAKSIEKEKKTQKAQEEEVKATLLSAT